MNFVQIRPFLEDSKEAVFSDENVKKCDFCVTKLVIFPKNGPTSSTSPHLVSPVTTPPKRDTQFVIIWSYFFQEISQNMNKIDDFRILCDHQLFQQDHVRFTFEDHHVLQKAHQTSD